MKNILLLHGALGSEKSFSKLKDLLSTEYQVYTFSFEGHGGREMPEHTLRIAHFADEVLAFLERNKLEKTAIFGYSMGGYVGLYLAKHFPEKVEKVFTLATKFDWTVEGASKEASMLNPTKIKEKVPKYAAALAQAHGENWELLVQKTAEMMLHLGENPAIKWTDLAEISLPIRIGVGDKDTMVNIAESQKAYLQLKEGQFLVMPNTPHPLEKVDMAELAHQIKHYFGF